jgi:hypothetical protein
MSYDKCSNYDVNYDSNGLSMLVEEIRRYFRTLALRETNYLALERLKAWLLLDMIE